MKKIIGIGIVFLFAIGYLFVVFGADAFNKENPWQTQTSESSVSIDVTPKSFDGENLIVEIGVNTHTIELNQFNLKELVTLEMEGKTFSPVTAPQLTGHHSKGQLVFATEKKPKTFTLTIKDIPDIPVRTLTWRSQ